MGMLLALAAAAVPLAIAPGWSFYFDVVPRIVILLAAAALALGFGGRIPAGSLFLKLIAAQAAAAAIATIFSIDPAISWFGAAWRKEGLPVELAVLTFAAAIYIWLSAAPERLRPFLRVTVYGVLPAAIYGIAQYFGIDPLLASSGYRTGEGQFAIVRPPSTLGHADYFAAFLLYPLFAGLFLARLEDRRRVDFAAGPRRHDFERHPRRAGRRAGRSGADPRARAFPAPPRVSIHRPRRRRAGDFRRVLPVGRRRKASRASSLVAGGSPRRRAPAALARHAQNERIALACRLRAGNVRARISQTRIGGSGARLSGFLSRIPAQYFH